MSETRSYSPEDVTVTWGPFTIDGFMDGTAIEVERDEDGATKHVGLKGQATKVINPNTCGAATFTLTQGSPSNDDLSATLILAEATKGGINYPLTVTDRNGRTNVFARDAWIKKAPKLERGKDLAPAVWVFDTGPMKTYVGGAVR